MQPYNPQITPQYGGTNPGAPTVGHETRDVNVRAVLIFLVLLAVCGVGVFAVCYGVYSAFDRYASKEDGPPTTWNAPAARADAARTKRMEEQGANRFAMEQQQYEDRTERFPQPRLQTDDTRDMQMLRQQEDAQLGYYVWLDPSQGRVAIPIDRAIDVIAERGLPTVPNARPINMNRPLTVGVTKVAHGSSHDPKRGGDVSNFF